MVFESTSRSPQYLSNRDAHWKIQEVAARFLGHVVRDVQQVVSCEGDLQVVKKPKIRVTYL